MQFHGPAVAPFHCCLAAGRITTVLRLAGCPVRTVLPDPDVPRKLTLADDALAKQMLRLVQGALRTHQLGDPVLAEWKSPVIQGFHACAVQCSCAHAAPIAMKC